MTTRRRWTGARRWFVSLPVSARVVLGAVVLLMLLGVTLSSVGTTSFSDDDQTVTGVLAGEPLPIRRDEWLRDSPWMIGLTADRSGSFTTPLAEQHTLVTHVATSGVAGRLVFLDGEVRHLSPVIGRERAFALHWWFPTLVFWLAGPRFLRVLGVDRRLHDLVLCLAYFNPAMAWWSLLPVASGLSAAVAGVATLDWLVEHRERVRGPTGQRLGWVAVLVVCAALCARLPLSYVPWSVVFVLGLFLPAVSLVAARHGWRPSAATAGAVGGTAVAVLGITLAEHWQALQAMLDTVYPGERRTTPAFPGFGTVFGAPLLGELTAGPEIVGSNQSELATGYMILLVPIALLVPWARSARSSFDRASAWVTMSCLGLLLFWVLTTVPSDLLLRVPGLPLSTPLRITQMLGMCLAFWFGVLASAATRGSHPGTRVVSTPAVFTAVLFALTMAGADLQTRHLPSLPARTVLWVALFWAVGLAWTVSRRSALRAAGSVMLVSFAVVSFANVNPLQHGFGSLLASAAARTITPIADAEEGRWASDAVTLDGILLANAVPSLSGQQWTGPDRDAWHLLDPTGLYEGSWNRGASYVNFVWTPDSGAVLIDVPVPDVIRVAADPCLPELDQLGLRFIVASAPLDAPCLLLRATFPFRAVERFVYERT